MCISPRDRSRFCEINYLLACLMGLFIDISQRTQTQWQQIYIYNDIYKLLYVTDKSIEDYYLSNRLPTSVFLGFLLLDVNDITLAFY